MIRRPPRSTRTDTRFPYTTLFRSCGVGRGLDLAPDVLARAQAQRLQPLLVAHEGVERGLHLPHPARHPDRALLDHADPQRRVPLEHPVEDHRGEGLGGRAGDRSEEHTSELQSLMRISYAVFCLTTKNK